MYDKADILQALMHRDGISLAEAEEVFDEAKNAVANGEDPEEVCYEILGLEPDYTFALI